MSTLVAPASAQQSTQPLSQEELQRVAEKEAARRQAGLPPPPTPPAGGWVSGPQPSDKTTATVRVTKTQQLEALQRFEAYVSSVERALEQVGRDPKEAAYLRAQLNKRRQEIEALPDGPISVTESGKHVGQHSIMWGAFMRDVPGGKEKDPTNLIFYGVGSAFDVNFDLRNWTVEGKQWQATCGQDHYVFIWDAQHTGGVDDYRLNDFQLEPEDVVNTCPGFGQSPRPLRVRTHLRLFDSFVVDSHGEFGKWSIGAVHVDRVFHGCGTQWEAAEAQVRESFKDELGRPLPFVGVIYTSYVGYEGLYGCPIVDPITGQYLDPEPDYNDGYDTFIQLLR